MTSKISKFMIGALYIISIIGMVQAVILLFCSLIIGMLVLIFGIPDLILMREITQLLEHEIFQFILCLLLYLYSKAEIKRIKRIEKEAGS